MKISSYNYVKQYKSEYIVFNKFFGSVATITNATANALKSNRLDTLDSAELATCVDNGFVVEDDFDEKAEGQKRFEDGKYSSSILEFIFELTKNCNYACPYCYQNNNRYTTNLSFELIQKSALYVRNVLQLDSRPIEVLQLNFIGGEPLLRKRSIFAAISEFQKIADGARISLRKKIDTNGYYLDESIVRAFDLISIAITNRSDHDKFRPQRNGTGSYDQILQNLERLKDVFNQTGSLLSVRFNVNHENVDHIKMFYNTLEGLGIQNFQMNLAYTINYDYNLFQNQLSRKQFQVIYLDFLRFLADKNRPIIDFPLPIFRTCKAYIPYNLKVSAEGKLALCDAFTNTIAHIDELFDAPANYFKIFKAYASYSPYSDPTCNNCPNIGICGGKYFCKLDGNTPDLEPCNFLPYDLDAFLDFFVETFSEKPDLFLSLREST